MTIKSLFSEKIGTAVKSDRRGMPLMVSGAVLVVLTLLLGFCNTHYVSADTGEEVVLISKPWFGGGGYYDQTLVGPNTKFTWGTTTGIAVNMQPVQHTLEINDLMSSDGVPLDFDATVVTQVTDAKALVARFGPKWYDNNISTELKSYIRDAVKKYGLNETAISTTAVAAIDAEVSQRLDAYLIKSKFPVKIVRFTVGKANPPDSVKDQRIETAAAQQRALTYAAQNTAEKERKQSEQSRAEADRAYQTNLGLTGEQYMEKLRLQTLEKVCGQKESKCSFVQPGMNLLISK